MGRGRASSGRFDHPAAVEWLHTVLSDPRIDGSAVAIGVLSLLRLLPEQSIEPARLDWSCAMRAALDELCCTYLAPLRNSVCHSPYGAIRCKAGPAEVSS